MCVQSPVPQSSPLSCQVSKARVLSSKLTPFPLSSAVATVLDLMFYFPIPNFMLHMFSSDLRLGFSFVVDSCLEIWIQSLPQFIEQEAFCLFGSSLSTGWAGIEYVSQAGHKCAISYSLSLPSGYHFYVHSYLEKVKPWGQ